MIHWDRNRPRWDVWKLPDGRYTTRKAQAPPVQVSGEYIGRIECSAGGKNAVVAILSAWRGHKRNAAM